MREIIKAIAYECNYKNFKKDTDMDGDPIYDWGEAVFALFNAKNSHERSVLKLDIMQRGKDDNGFYQNYIYFVVKKDSPVLWDEYLTSLGYVYTKKEINLCKIVIDYTEGIDDYIVEVE